MPCPCPISTQYIENQNQNYNNSKICNQLESYKQKNLINKTQNHFLFFIANATMVGVRVGHYVYRCNGFEEMRNRKKW